MGTPAVWTLRTAAGAGRGEGVLAQYSHSDGNDHYTIQYRHAGGQAEITVAEVRTRQFTVWRFFDQLDMIQLRVEGGSTSVHAQLGGTHVLPVFAALEGDEYRDTSLHTAMHLYHTGAFKQFD